MSEERVRVAVRIRSLLPKEVLHKHRVCVRAAPDNKQVIFGTEQLFPFDYVFGPTVSQNEVYESCVQPLVKSLLDGYNATVFCYGQTGSGKTYTLGGRNLDDEGGVIDRVAQDVFSLLEEKRQSRQSMEVTLRVSYLELYMEEVRDLLQLHSNPKELHIRDDDRGNTVVVGAKETVVTSAEDLLSIVEVGNALRHTGTTGMNERSSRSHAILIIQLSQRCLTNKSIPNPACLSKLCLVDLAGSERAGKTGNTGARFKESVFINTDLLALSKVIRALSDPGQKGSNTHIPYRDSKITRLLRDSLGGTAHTLMITCVSPSHDNIAETLCALQFATRARHIRNRPGEMCSHTEVTMCPTNWNQGKGRLEEMEHEIHTLRGLLKEKGADLEVERGKTESRVGWEDSSCQMKIPDPDRKMNQEDTIQACILVQEAADLLTDISCSLPSPSSKHRLQVWQEKLKAFNYSHQTDDNNCVKENGDQPHHVTMLQFRRELLKCQEALAIEKKVMKNKNIELRQVQNEIGKLHYEGKTHIQALQEEKERTRMQTEQLVDQQILIDRLRDDLLTVRGETPGNSGRRPLSVPLIRHICGQAPVRHSIYSSPPAYSLERVMAAFRMRNQLLLSETEEKDEVYSPFIKRQTESKDRDQEEQEEEEEEQQEEEDEEEEEEEDTKGRTGFRRSLNLTWTSRKRKPSVKQKNPGMDQISDGILLNEKAHYRRWLELEEERVLQRRTQLQELEEELRRREEVLQQKEACVLQKNKLEVKKCSSSQALSHDLLCVSMRLETLDEQLESSSRTGRVTTEELERERDALRSRRDALDAQLKDNRVLTAEEEHSLLELDEAVYILDVAVQFKNHSIQDKQQKLSIKDCCSSQSHSSEPAQLCDLTRRLKELSTPEASELLIRYFNKVVCLREAENHLRLRCEELELRVEDQEGALKEMEASLQRLALAADRRLTQQHQDHQTSIQLLLQKLKDDGSGEAQQAFQVKLQKELYSDAHHGITEAEHTQADTQPSHTRTYSIQANEPVTNSEPMQTKTHIATTCRKIDADQIHKKIHIDQAKMNQTHNSCTSSSPDSHTHKKTKVHTHAQHLGNNERAADEAQMIKVCLSRRQLRQVFPTNLQDCDSATRRRHSAVDITETMLEEGDRNGDS
ncbi:kinesin-like protein KIF27 [Genypterus blacodes]|uniref:kinesin-like protein KIF27 n=1 Tax=Genypterus blacodes TaxID=154954 RepID=UPI003F765534